MISEQMTGKLKELLQERFSINPAKINENTRLGDIGIDSLHIVDLMLDIESELEFGFDSLNLPPNPSITEICNAIIENMK